MREQPQKGRRHHDAKLHENSFYIQQLGTSQQLRRQSCKTPKASDVVYFTLGIMKDVSVGSELSNKLHKEFLAESDRGCAVLTVCLIEETLAALFEKVLPTKEVSARHFMPPGRLRQGLESAIALGLVTEPTATNIRLILSVRNTFAHKLLSGLSFESPEVRDHVMKMQLPNLDGMSEISRKKIQDVSRERYMHVLGHALADMNRVIHIAKPFPIYPALPAYSVEV